MKRTVEITTRYQPVIDYYKGYNNAEFNVLTNNLLCSYKLLKQEKNLDLLMLIECLKGYSITLPELMALISQHFENIPQEKIKEMEMTNLSSETVDILNTPKSQRVRKPRAEKTQHTEQHTENQIQQPQQMYAQPVMQPVYPNMPQQMMYPQMQGYPQGYPQMYGQQGYPPPAPQQMPVQQSVPQENNLSEKNVKPETQKENISPKNRKFNILDVGIDLSE